MKRLLAVVSSAAIVLALGCSSRYQYRLEKTLEQMKYQERLNQFLNQPEAGAFQELGVYLRPPKPLTKADQVIDLHSFDPGSYEIVASFIDRGASGTTAQAAEKKAVETVPVRLHVLARVKRPKKPAGKKGEPPPSDSPRGDFATDLRVVLASDYGNPDVNDGTKVPAKSDKKGLNDFRKIAFQANNQDNIRAYFLKQGDYDVVLVWDVPAAAEKAAATGIDLCLESFAVGPRALNKFKGGSDEESSGPAAGGGEAGAGGQSF